MELVPGSLSILWLLSEKALPAHRCSLGALGPRGQRLLCHGGLSPDTDSGVPEPAHNVRAPRRQGLNARASGPFQGHLIYEGRNLGQDWEAGPGRLGREAAACRWCSCRILGLGPGPEPTPPGTRGGRWPWPARWQPPSQDPRHDRWVLGRSQRGGGRLAPPAPTASLQPSSRPPPLGGGWDPGSWASAPVPC